VRHDAGTVRAARRGVFSAVLHGVPGIDGQEGGASGDPVERLMARLEERGIGALSQVTGVFVAIVWDEGVRELTLATDPLATRPLHLTTLPDGTLLFATEYKAFLAIPAFQAKPDMDMIQHLQYCKHMPAGRTLLQGVSTVPPGCVMTFDANGRLVRKSTLPSLEIQIRERSFEECEADLLGSFRASLEHILRNQSRIGIALSGGVDSMAVACACRRLCPDAEIHTFTAFNGADDPERLRAGRVAEFIKSRHHEVETPPSLMTTELPELVWHIENPIARSESLQLLMIGREAAKAGVGSLVTGVGSDSLFAGQHKHKILWLKQLVPPAARPLEEFYVLSQTGVRPQTVGGKFLDWLYFRGRLPDVPRIRGSGYWPPATVFLKPGPEYVNRSAVGMFRSGVEAWMPKFERVFAASNVDITSPYLDSRMIVTAFSITDRYKIVRGAGKYIMRQALRSTMPPGLFQAPKSPQRLRPTSGMDDVIERVADIYLSPERVKQRGWFDPDEMMAIRDFRGSGGYVFEAAMRLWTAVLTEIWAETFLDRRNR
jgi:asparagine synthase (glutamine-hydrolysing)